MIYLLWSLFNLFLVLSFLYFAIGLIFRGRKTIEPYFKPFVFVVLFLGLTGMLRSSTKKEKSNSLEIPRLLEQTTYPVFSQLSNKMHLTVFRDPKTKEVIQEYSISRISGLVMGIRWNHLMVIENKNGLEVEGWWDWYLMGNRIFSNYETYQIADNNPDLN